MGAILRDYQGNFVAAASHFIPNVSSAGMAEAFAMRNGLSLASSLGYKAIEAESDSIEVIQICSGEVRMWNEATTIYSEILSHAGIIGKVDFMHCGRDSNYAAHYIARECFNSKVGCNWADEPPSFLAQTLLNDVTVI
jgi:hypothetical protein